QDADPEAPDARHAPGAVVVFEPVEPGPVLVQPDQPERDGPSLLRREPVLGEWNQPAIDAGAEEIPGLDVEVRSSPLHRGLEDPFDRNAGHQAAPAGRNPIRASTSRMVSTAMARARPAPSARTRFTPLRSSRRA